jgi:hypothetical protein
MPARQPHPGSLRFGAVGPSIQLAPEQARSLCHLGELTQLPGGVGRLRFTVVGPPFSLQLRGSGSAGRSAERVHEGSARTGGFATLEGISLASSGQVPRARLNDAGV